MQQAFFRAPAVPLITHDPFFTLYSFTDRLTDDSTRHWDGSRRYMFGLLAVDDHLYEFMGTMYADNRYLCGGCDKLPQTGCVIRPMTTVYTFENETVALELTFTSPLLLDDLQVLSRPLSYVSYRIHARDGKKHAYHVYFGFSGEFCVNETTQEVYVETTPYSVCFSSGTEHMLKNKGDEHRIEWGTFHVIAQSFLQGATSLRHFQAMVSDRYSHRLYPVSRQAHQGAEYLGPQQYRVCERVPVHPYYPTIYIQKNYSDAGSVSDMFALAYDDVKCIQYFGKNLDAYWKKDGQSFSQMVHRAMHEYDEILARVKAFEDDLLEKASAISPQYADLLSLAYRQTVSGHKLTWDGDEILFISRENNSNGCAATVDITYPSLPLFLLCAPDLVEGMLNPIFRMLEEGLWDEEFAPHDIGTYPLCNGQMYGCGIHYRHRSHMSDYQMPVEECGNMLLCVAALCLSRGDVSYFHRHSAILRQWADYLVRVGFNPDHQLCTDDFAGHLAHNVNLSAKAICALGAYALILRRAGDEDSAAYYDGIARQNAKAWEAAADDGDHYRLAFDQAGTWSLKYNMVWDKFLGIDLFSQQVYDKELAHYRKQIRRYGIPLDSRGDCTKTDWEMWTTCLFDDPEYTRSIVQAIWNFVTETPDRAPFPDLHFVSRPYRSAFQARTVQGALFLPLLHL